MKKNKLLGAPVFQMNVLILSQIMHFEPCMMHKLFSTNKRSPQTI